MNCGNSEAILIEKATFGRMAIGKCVHTDFGYIGCKNDVLSLADRWCSGLQNCVVTVSNDDLDEANKACSADLNSYLDVDYSCVPGKKRNIIAINIIFIFINTFLSQINILIQGSSGGDQLISVLRDHQLV